GVLAGRDGTHDAGADAAHDLAVLWGRHAERALERSQRQRNRWRELRDLSRYVDVDESDAALGELVGQRAGLEVSGVVEVCPPVEGRKLDKAHAQHVARLGPLHTYRANDGVWAPTWIFAAELRQLLNRDAPLEPIQEMRPRVGIHHDVAGIDLKDI